MVYCNLRISNLSPEFAAGIPDTKGNFMILNYMVMLKVKLLLNSLSNEYRIFIYH